MHKYLLPMGLWAVFGVSAAHAATLDYSTRENTLAWFEGARFGIFIHWDARSNWNLENARFKNVDIRPNIKRNHEDAVWGEVLDAAGKPTEKRRWQTWNPAEFNAEKWVELFVASGARYFTFTTMHMFSQSNFDHPSSTFDSRSTPWGQDACALLAKAAKGKIAVMWYYNMHPAKHVTGDRFAYFKTMLANPSCSWDEFRKAGIHELVRNTDRYGNVAGIWCDGGGDGLFKKNEVNRDFYTKMKEVQPWLIFSPRCGHPDIPRDWRVPEQKMASVNWETPQEMTMPIESDQWFWAGGKEVNTKDAAYCIETLIQTACRDANLLLNISPRGNGEIEPRQQEVLRAIGAWLDKNGEAIFETRAGPYEPGCWGGSTRRGKKVYLHLTQQSQNGRHRLPALPSRILSSRLLAGGSVEVTPSDDALLIKLGRDALERKDVLAHIVELTIAEDAWKMLPAQLIPVPVGKTLDAKATASSENTYKRPSNKSVVDSAGRVLEHSGYWSASEPWSEAGADSSPWLQLDFGKPVSFHEINVQERHSRIQHFVLEYRDAETGAWNEIYAGDRLNHLSYRLAAPVTARQVRLRIAKAEGGAPQVVLFEVRTGGKDTVTSPR